MKQKSDIFKRKGILKISDDIIEDNPELVMKVLNNVLVRFIENNPFARTNTYYCYSPKFRIVPEEENIPKYNITIFNEGEDIQFLEEGGK